MEKDVDALSDFEELNKAQSEEKDKERKDSVWRRKSCDMGDIGRNSPQFFRKAGSNQEYDQLEL